MQLRMDLVVIEDRCVIDGCPACDHMPLREAAAQFRYVWRAWYRHRLFQARAMLRGHT
jgi:hypothetical protein